MTLKIGINGFGRMVLRAVAQDAEFQDIGPQAAAKLAEKLKQAGTIVWNGPVGVFEFVAFENGTKVIAQAIAESSAFSIAGGGTRWRRSPSTATRRTWATSPPVAAPSSKCPNARRCQRLRSWPAGPHPESFNPTETSSWP